MYNKVFWFQVELYWNVCMSDYAVIAQNDESKWDDVKGDLYNYPATYRNILTKCFMIIHFLVYK